MADLHWLVWLLLIAPVAIVVSIFGSRVLWRLAAEAEPQYFGHQPRPPAPPVCPQCGYNLYFAKDQRCPECGRPFDIREVDMRLAAWDGHVLQPKEPEKPDEDTRS